MPEDPCHARAGKTPDRGRPARFTSPAVVPAMPERARRPRSGKGNPAKSSIQSTTTAAIVVAFTRLIDHGTRRIVSRRGSALRAGRDGAILRLILGSVLWLVLRAILRTVVSMIVRRSLHRTIVARAVDGIAVVRPVAIVVTAIIVSVRPVVGGRVITTPAAVAGTITRAVSGTIVGVRRARAKQG